MESTVLSTVCYDEAQALLQVEFCGRAIYQDFGVPPVIHQTLLAAPSKRSYFNQAIRGRFLFRRISEWNADGPEADGVVRSN